MNDFMEFLGEVALPIILLTIGALVFALLLGFALVAPWEYAQCKSKSRAMNLENTWGPLQGCIVKTPEGYITLDAYLNRTVPQNINIK